MGAGGNSNLYFATSSLVGAVGSLATGYAQSKALEASGVYEKQQFDFNSKIAELQAEDAKKRGDIAASRARSKGKQLVGAQKAAYAGGNISVDTGSAVDVYSETVKLSEMDAITIKNNALQEAWGYKAEAANSSFKGRFAQTSNNFAATNTLLAGGMNAIAGAGRAGGYLSDYFGSSGKAPRIDTGGGRGGSMSRFGYNPERIG